MKAKFAGGPYDLFVVQITGPSTQIRLPFTLEATLDPKQRVWEGHAVYNFRHGNDIERVYYFDRLEM